MSGGRHAGLELSLGAAVPLVLVVTAERARAGRVIHDACRRLGRPSRTVTVFDPLLGQCASRLELFERLTDASEDGEAVVLAGFDRVLAEDETRLALAHAADRAVVRRVSLVFVAGGNPAEARALFDIHRLPLPDRTELLSIAVEERQRAGGTSGPEADSLTAAAAGLTAAECYAFCRKALHLAKAGTPPDAGRLLDLKIDIIRQSGVPLEIVPGVPGSQVGGMDQLKLWVAARARGFSAEAAAFGLAPPRGMLLLGVQGCGKSLMARAVAGIWGLPLVRLDLARLFGSGLSPEEGFLRAIGLADEIAPSVLWLDEIEKGFRTEGAAAGEVSRIMGSLLTWMQERARPVFVVATANRIDQLQPELVRKGRFDEVFFVDLPGEKERAEIAAIHLAARGRDPKRFDTARLASLADGFTGAEIEQAVVDALYFAFVKGRDISQKDIELALKTSVPLSATFEEEIKTLRDWAENRARGATFDTKLADLFK